MTFCSRCRAPIAPNSAFCPTCGAPVGRPGEAATSLKRPTIVTVLALLQFFGGTVSLLAGLFATVSLAAGEAGQTGAVVVGGILLAVGAFQLTCGVGLWQLKPYGRTLQLVSAWIGLIAIPVGTIISILILIYFFKPGVKVLFSGKPAGELTPVEWAQIGEVSHGGSVATVVIVVIVLVVAVGALGIVAAIAIPGLLRARISGNEAVAIGSLRTINAAQVTFSSTCGKGYYAPSLAALAIPPAGEQTGFVDSDLSLDPSVKSGYTIALTAGAPAPGAPVACNGVPVVASYFASAAPETVGTTGIRYFATNQEAEIFQSTSDIAVTHEGAPPDARPLR